MFNTTLSNGDFAGPKKDTTWQIKVVVYVKDWPISDPISLEFFTNRDELNSSPISGETIAGLIRGYEMESPAALQGVVTVEQQ